METSDPLPRARRAVYIGLGLLSTGLGIVGIVLPVMPTTVFLIIASALFMNAHPPLYRWLHRNRVLGPYVAAYTRKEGLSIGRKLWMIGILWATMAVSIILVADALWLRILLGSIGVAVTLHISLLRPARIVREEAGVENTSVTPVEAG